MSARTRALTLPATLGTVLAVAGLAAVGWLAFQVGRQTAAPQVISMGPRIEDIRKIAQLAVLRVQAADVIEGTTSGAKAILLVKGDADIAVDLDHVEVAERDDQAHRLTLLLPTPKAERPRVDHDRTKIYELRKTGLAALNPFADPRQVLLEDCMRAAQTAVEKAVQADEFVTQAKERTEQLLVSYHRDMGWEVAVRWR
jgi:hypothetical protein